MKTTLEVHKQPRVLTYKWSLKESKIVKRMELIITGTCLYNVDSFKSHFYILKLELTGVYIIFLISAQKQIVGTR